MQQLNEEIIGSEAYRCFLANLSAHERRKTRRKKNLVTFLAFLAGCLVAALLIHTIANAQEGPVPVEITAEPITVFSKKPPVAEPAPEPKPEPAARSFDYDGDEAYLLMKIAMAEAEGEDTEGKALVILTVLNRVWNDSFPDTVEEVIFQKGQFTPVANGRFEKVKANQDCYDALMLVESGWDESQGALYFERTTTESTWHTRNLEELFTYGNHTFYAEVDA